MVLRDIRTLPDVFPCLAIEVLDGAFFPGTVGMAEVKRYAECRFQLFVVAKQDIVVGGNGCDLWKHVLDALQGLQGIVHTDRQYFADEANTELAVCRGQAVTRSLLATHNEIYLQVTDMLPVGDHCGTVVDEGLCVSWWCRCWRMPLPASALLASLEYLEPVLDAAAMFR